MELSSKRIYANVSGMSKARILGTEKASNNNQSSSIIDSQNSSSFQDVLREKLEQTSNVTFTKHAMNRVVERNVDISDSSIERLNQGVKIAQEKGLNEALILVDSTAYIVSAKNERVITTVSNNDLKGNVFTNIDGTVII